MTKTFHHCDRRTLILNASIIAATLATGCKTVSRNTAQLNASSDGKRIRKRWTSSGSNEIKAEYIAVVQWLKSNDGGRFSANDPRSYLTWNRFINIHDQSCFHANWFIFPWHRLFVNYFEAAGQIALQKPGWSLPYWDWSLDPTIPDEFFTSPALMGERTVNLGDSIGGDIAGPEVMKDLLQLNDFYSFCSRPDDYFSRFISKVSPATGDFEGGPHNAVHNFIGGPMSSNRSPSDPIFWLHHSNIERIYMQWLQLHSDVEAGKVPITRFGGSAIAASGQAAEKWLRSELKLAYTDTDLQPEIVGLNGYKSSPTKMLVADIINPLFADYTYDAFIEVAPTPVPRDLKLAAIEQDLQILEGEATISESFASLRHFFASSEAQLLSLAAQNHHPASLVARGLRAPTDERLRQNLLLQFFVVLNGGLFDPRTAAKSHLRRSSDLIGSFSFGRSDHHHAGKDHEQGEILLNLRPWLSKNAAKVAVKQLDVWVVAVDIRARENLPYFASIPKMSLDLVFGLV